MVMTGHVLARAKRTSCKPCILLALSIALFSGCAWPQTQLATVFGIITDASGAVIPGTEVTAVNLLWENYDGEQIRISRSYWRSHVQEPKTKKSKAPVPVIAQLAERLNLHWALSANPASGLMFPTPKGRPINLDALATDVIRPTLNAQGLQWYGWHAFRRGLATNLHRLRVQDEIIQRILRHSNVSVTQACYIKTADADVVAAMRSLENAPNMHLESPKKSQVM